eukprot:scaffold164216_cov14-Prasinocladus_malaysianus.AAC.1
MGTDAVVGMSGDGQQPSCRCFVKVSQIMQAGFRWTLPANSSFDHWALRCCYASHIVFFLIMTQCL